MRVHVFSNSPSPAEAMYRLKKVALEGEKNHGLEARQFIDRNLMPWGRITESFLS